MSSSNSGGGGGIGFCGLLTILFIGLKLGGVIPWPWLWVLAPMWIPLGIVGLCTVVMVIILVLSGGHK